MQSPDAIATGRQRRTVALTLGAILLVAAACRFPDLDRMAPFVDETGHISAATDYSYFPFSERLRFGKMLGYVAFYPTARFATNPLHATRELVALVGVLTTLGVFFFTRRIASPASALVASLIWAAMPIAVFHERMALHDPIVAGLVVWSLVLMNAAMDRQSRATGLGAGALLGLGILTKVTAGLAIPWPLVVAVGLFGVDGLRRRVGPVVGYAAGLALPVCLMAYGVLILGPAEGTTFLIRTAGPGAWAGFSANLGAAVSWFASYNSVPFAVLGVVTLVSTLTKPSWLMSGLCMCFLVSVAAHALVFKDWFSRYLLFMLVPLVVMMGIVITESATATAAAIRRRFALPGDWLALGSLMGISLLLGFSAPHWLREDFAFSRNVSAARMPPFDRFQYLDGWPSGRGIETIATFMNWQVREGGPALLVVGGWGNHGWWSLPLVKKLDSRLVIRSQHLFSSAELASVANDAKRQPTFLLFEPPRYEAPAFLAQASPQPRLVFEYKRPRSDGGFQLYAIDPAAVIVSSAEDARRLDAGEPVITAVRNPNGIESRKGERFFWLGGGGTVIEVASHYSGTAELSANFVLGPSAAGPIRHVTISGEGGYAKQEEVGPGKKVLRVPLRAGTNSITLSCVERATIPSQPSGDVRPLVLGVQGLTVTTATPRSPS